MVFFEKKNFVFFEKKFFFFFLLFIFQFLKKKNFPLGYFFDKCPAWDGNNNWTNSLYDSNVKNIKKDRFVLKNVSDVFAILFLFLSPLIVL